MSRRLAFVLAALAAVACGEESPSGLGEPIIARGASLKEGPLPGTPPSEAPATPDEPVVTLVDTVNPIVYAGTSQRELNGRTTPNAVAVAFRFPDVGTGYWVLPVADPDPAANNELTWRVQYEIAAKLPPGKRRLLVVAIDANGRAGRQRPFDVCVASAIPDNLNSCEPTIAPPEAVLSLTWDRPMDLDLQLVTPTGKRVDPRSPTTAPPVGGTTIGTKPTENDGIFDLDAVAECHTEGRRRESILWQKLPLDQRPHTVYVNVTEACGETTANFRVTFHRSVAQPDGTFRLVEVWRREGQVLGIDANGGGVLGTFVTNLTF